jgi:hypothetical protein
MNIHILQCRVSIRGVAAALVTVSALAWNAAAVAQTPAPATQSSAEGGVTVKVTPKVVAPGAGEWEFAIVLDTHSADLSDDLEKSTLLRVNGRELRPIGWSGAAPGGHHREGTLKFAAPVQPAETIELRIQRPGEATARVFRWSSAALR